jgi:16S rRNA (cytosine1402-N4)-methyltransferase
MKEIIEGLIAPFESAPSPGIFIDCTLGGGGHTAAMLERLLSTRLGAAHRVVSVDQDAGAIAASSARFAEEIGQGRLTLLHSRFSSFPEVFPPGLRSMPVLGALADLGFSSDQIDSPERGLSFRLEGPLDMRLDPTRGRTARQLLATESERAIADLLWTLGEERLSRKIAHRIVQARASGQLPDTTTGLATLIAGCFPPPVRHGKIHPATRSFQALRIAVNDELGELDTLLDVVLPSWVSPGGRAAFLSFHSLEDRRIKQAFSAKGDSARWIPINRKPVEAGEVELASNPRARSAKLRIAERRSDQDEGRVE